jgi:hypothetical protein
MILKFYIMTEVKEIKDYNTLIINTVLREDIINIITPTLISEILNINSDIKPETFKKLIEIFTLGYVDCSLIFDELIKGKSRSKLAKLTEITDVCYDFLLTLATLCKKEKILRLYIRPPKKYKKTLAVSDLKLIKKFYKVCSTCRTVDEYKKFITDNKILPDIMCLKNLNNNSRIQWREIINFLKASVELGYVPNESTLALYSGHLTGELDCYFYVLEYIYKDKSLINKIILKRLKNYNNRSLNIISKLVKYLLDNNFDYKEIPADILHSVSLEIKLQILVNHNDRKLLESIVKKNIIRTNKKGIYKTENIVNLPLIEDSDEPCECGLDHINDYDDTGNIISPTIHSELDKVFNKLDKFDIGNDITFSNLVIEKGDDKLFNILMQHNLLKIDNNSLTLACKSGSKFMIEQLINMKLIPDKECGKYVSKLDNNSIKTLVASGLAMNNDMLDSLLSKKSNISILENLGIELDDTIAFFLHKHQKYLSDLEVEKFKEPFKTQLKLRNMFVDAEDLTEIKKFIAHNNLIPDQYCYDNSLGNSDKNMLWLENEYDMKPTLLSLTKYNMGRYMSICKHININNANDKIDIYNGNYYNIYMNNPYKAKTDWVTEFLKIHPILETKHTKYSLKKTKHSVRRFFR